MQSQLMIYGLINIQAQFYIVNSRFRSSGKQRTLEKKKKKKDWFCSGQVLETRERKEPQRESTVGYTVLPHVSELPLLWETMQKQRVGPHDAVLFELLFWFGKL